MGEDGAKFHWGILMALLALAVGSLAGAIGATNSDSPWVPVLYVASALFGLAALILFVYDSGAVWRSRRRAAKPSPDVFRAGRATKGLGEERTWGERTDATVRPETVHAVASVPAVTVDTEDELPPRELTDEEEKFLLGPTNRPDEPITAGLGRPIDPQRSEAIGRVRRAAHHVRELIDQTDKALPPLEVLRGAPAQRAIWELEREQAALGRYYNKLHRHVVVAVDGLRPYVAHDELDRLYKNPRNTGDIRMIAKLLDAVADMAMTDLD